jgi:hypothetical protein
MLEALEHAIHLVAHYREDIAGAGNRSIACLGNLGLGRH